MLRRNENAGRIDNTENVGNAVDPVDTAAEKDLAAIESLSGARDAGKPRSASGDILDILSSHDLFSAQRGTTQADSTNRSAAEKNTLNGGKGETASEVSKTGANLKEAESKKTTVASEKELTPEELAQVDELKARDQEVKTHEAAHLAAAGQYATSGASYTYRTGPDGKRYAVGGEVSIDASPISGDPQATIAKMQQVRNAALAPASPSSQDYKVAAAASEQEARARMELARERTENAGIQGAVGEIAGQSLASEATASAKTASEKAASAKAASEETRDRTTTYEANASGVGTVETAETAATAEIKAASDAAGPRPLHVASHAASNADSAGSSKSVADGGQPARGQTDSRQTGSRQPAPPLMDRVAAHYLSNSRLADNRLAAGVQPSSIRFGIYA